MENRVLPFVSVRSSFSFLGVKENKANHFPPFFFPLRSVWVGGGGSAFQGHSTRSDGLGVSTKSKHYCVPQSSALVLHLWNSDTEMAKVRELLCGYLLGSHSSLYSSLCRLSIYGNKCRMEHTSFRANGSKVLSGAQLDQLFSFVGLAVIRVFRTIASAKAVVSKF